MNKFIVIKDTLVNIKYIVLIEPYLKENQIQVMLSDDYDNLNFDFNDEASVKQELKNIAIQIAELNKQVYTEE
jgi:hypothetical protein